MEMTKKDLRSLEYAHELLENPGLAARMANLMGLPIEKGLQMLPTAWAETIYHITRASLQKALDIAVNTLGNRSPGAGSIDLLHKIAVATTGAVGGAFGLSALSVELPISTALMLRSIADIALSEGEKVRTVEGKLACLEVFALGGGGDKKAVAQAEDSTAVETGYYAVRGALARAVSEAAKYIAEKGLLEEGAPVIVRFITRIASRFTTTVTEKVVAQAVPLIGAAGGAVVNTVFMDHFQEMARGHFIIRRLERVYGAKEVKAAYAAI